LFCLDYTQSKAVTEKVNGINVRREHLPGILYRLSALAYTFPAYHLLLKKRIYRFIRDNKIQAVHIHDMRIARSVFWVTRKLHIPTVLDLHENRPEIMKYYGFVNSLLGNLLIYPSVWKKFEYKYIREARKVIVVTEEAKEYYLRETKVKQNKISVLPNTVRKEFYTNYKVHKSIIEKYTHYFVVLYLGDTGFRRGLTTAIESLKYLVKLIPEIKIVVVGTSDNDSFLRRLVGTLNVEDYVDFEGWVDVSLFPSYILASQIGICPIHQNIHHNTTYANKIFQSLAFGKPVVVSDCRAQMNIVKKYNFGLVFKDRDAKDFADKIVENVRNRHNDL
jgi:glycosyltransferase involved in cell wall biosynthesis